MGRAAALLFAREGAKIVGCDVNEATGQATLEAVRAIGGHMMSLQPCNMAKRADVDRLMSLAVDAYGGVDVLYNNGSCWAASACRRTSRRWRCTSPPTNRHG